MVCNKAAAISFCLQNFPKTHYNPLFNSVMKKSILLSAVLLGTTLTSTIAQTTALIPNPPRKIEVTGSAELEVVPDELYFNVSLREYYGDEKNQKDKVNISVLEKQLVKAIADAGLPKQTLSLSSVGGYHNYVDKKKKPTTFLETKQYELKIDRADKLDLILSKIESRGIQYANITRVDHSQKEAYKKQVKIDALKAAKEKATYLLESVGQKLGPALEIRELEDNAYYPQPMYKANMRAMAVAEAADAVQESNVEFQKIKISYKMQAAFEIK
jgi:uncharacterized protein YggE